MISKIQVIIIGGGPSPPMRILRRDLRLDTGGPGVRNLSDMVSMFNCPESLLSDSGRPRPRGQFQ